MGKDTIIGHKKGNSDDENWRTQRRGNSRASSPKKLSEGTSRVSSTSSLSSLSSNGHRREAGNSSSSSSASSSRTSSTTSVTKSATSKESHQGGSSLHSHGHVNSGNSHTRKNKRMRTKSARKHHHVYEEAVNTSSPEAVGDRRQSPTSNKSGSRRKGDDYKSRHRHEPKGNRADKEYSWRRRSPTAGNTTTSNAKEDHVTNSSRDRGNAGHGSGGMNQTVSTNTVDRVSSDNKTRVEPRERNGSTKEQKEIVKGSEENFDFASDIFKDGELKCTKSIKSNSATNADLRKDARSLRLLKLSDERRKKEYLGYQPTYVHKLYSFGMDNKGKKEPQKTGLGKKEEDMMFRKRAVYMMHLEEERKRKEREEKRAERSGISKSNETNVNDISEELKEIVKRKNVAHGWQRKIQESEQDRRETMVKERNRLLHDMEIALPGACEMETIPEDLDEGRSASDHEINGQTKHQFAKALNLRIEPDKPDEGKCSSSSMDTHLDLEKFGSHSHQNSTQSDSEEFELETEGQDASAVGDKDVSSPCDVFDTNEELVSADVTSDHDVASNKKEPCRDRDEGYSKGPAATNEGVSDPKTIKVKQEGDLVGRHCGLPPVISDLHHKDNGKVFAASRKESVIRISPKTVRLDQESSSSDKVVIGAEQQLDKRSMVCKESSTSLKYKVTSTGAQEDDLKHASLETQKEGVLDTRIHEPALSNADKLPKPHATSKVKQDEAPVVSLKNSFTGSRPSHSPKVTPSQHYARIAPAKSVTGNPKYVLPPASSYVQASSHQGLLDISPSLIGSKGNLLPVFGSQIQNMLQASSNVYLQNTLSSVEVKPPTIQLSHGNRSLVSQVNNAANCLSVPPVVVLPNNILPGVSAHQNVYGHNMNFDGSAVAGGGGIDSGLTCVKASQPKNTSNIDLRPSANIDVQRTTVISGGGIQATTSGENENAPVPSKSQGLLGYINVPVIKDDQGRLVMILPNDKTIMGTTQTRKGEVRNEPSKDVEVVQTNPVVHRDYTESKQLLGTSLKSTISRHQSGLSTDHCNSQIIKSVPKDDVNSVEVHPSLVCTKGVSSQATECKSCKSDQIVKRTSVVKQTSQIPLAAPNASDVQDFKQKINEARKSSKSTSKKTLENPDVGNKNDWSSQSKSVEELLVRQRAITAKLKELRSVRVLIAKHSRMEEEECVRMVERLKQVEDLFFRQLIATSKELDGGLKTRQEIDKMNARSTEGGAAEDSLARNKLVRDGNGSITAHSNLTNSRSFDSKVKRSDETVDKLFNTAHLLRNCISAMAKKRHVKHGRRDESSSVGNKEGHMPSQRGELATKVERISKGVDSKEQDTETPPDSKMHNVSSTSTVSTEQESDMSIGSPQVHQYHLQPQNSKEDASTDKIVLRLQRVRNRDDSSSASIEDAKNTKWPAGKRGDDNVETDERPQLPEVPSNRTRYEVNSMTKTDSNEHDCVSDGSNQSRNSAKVDNDSQCISHVAMSGSNKECNRDSSNDSGTISRSKVGSRDDSSNGSLSEGRPSRFITKQASGKDRKYAVFTGPTKEQIREEDRREREMVKEAWNRVFPSSSSDPTREHREDSLSSDSEQQRLSSKSRGHACGKEKQKQVKHVYGNPVIRGNLTSIGNINVTRQVGGSSETKFQWLLKQLQKKRNGGSQWKHKDQLRMQTSTEPTGEDGREYVSLISRGVQTSGSRIEDGGNANTGRKLIVAEQEEKDDDKENQGASAMFPADHNPSSGNQIGNTKKRGRESTGSGEKPQEKLPRIRSPTSDVDENESTGVTDPNDELQDLISLRDEVLSRQSSSSEDTVEYSDNLISVEENVRRLKPLEKEKKKLKSTGTMTASEPLTNDPLSLKQSKTSASRKFATKTRGHGRYSWCKKKISSKISTSKGSKKRTTGVKAKTKTKAKTPLAKNNAVILISDDSLQEQSEEEIPEKEKVTQKTRRNTLASLSARLWDECYWSTINDTSNPDVGAAKNILPSNNSPPTTRRTGLESKMMGLWSDLLRYSGNYQDVETLPLALEDLDRMDLPAPLANSMKILLEGYNMVKQGSSTANQDSKSSLEIQNDGTLNENNSAEIHVVQPNESAHIPWEEPRKEEIEDVTDTSPSYDEESHVSSSTWEASVSTEFTLDTLTSHSANTVGSGPTYHSSSTTASPPSLGTEDGYVPVELPQTNLRRWPTRMELASAAVVNGSISPDYSADIMNRNDPHEEGDSGRSGSERADAMTVGTSGWQISGAGDLREPRLLTAPKATARNRRRQNRVMSWPNIVHDEEDSDDDIPLAKWIEIERLKRLQREAAQGHQPRYTNPQDDHTEGLDKGTIPSSPESELPEPFLLGQSGLGDDMPVDILDAVAEEKQRRVTESKQNDATEEKKRGQMVSGSDMQSRPNTEHSHDVHQEKPGGHKPVNSRSESLKKSGKFLYGHSKKGKALVKKGNQTSQEISQQLSSKSDEAGSSMSGMRFVVSCSPHADDVGNGNHLYYRSDSSPDIFV